MGQGHQAEYVRMAPRTIQYSDEFIFSIRNFMKILLDRVSELNLDFQIGMTKDFLRIHATNPHRTHNRRLPRLIAIFQQRTALLEPDGLSARPPQNLTRNISL